MHAEHWLDIWSEERIGFHQKNVNSRLQMYWSSLNVDAQAPVFVPLCGKSTDMLWLHQQGHPIVGVELSDKAVRAFFTDNKLPFKQTERDAFDIYAGIEQAEGIELWVGDFFSLRPEHLAHCGAFYDRASLIAMNEPLRADYASHLGSITAAGSRGLLLSIAYDQSRMNGPPFSVPDETVRELLGVDFSILELEFFHGPERLGNLAQRGLETIEEWVYLLERYPVKSTS